jgi:glutamate formiminotransferase / 5-formyltetrahydrofolate cyclo-ligase
MSDPVPLLAVPNVSEGRDGAALEAISAAFTCERAAILLNQHSDADHHRAVLTLAGRPGALAGALIAGAAAAVERIDVMAGADGERQRGEHPHVGAVDVMPVVYLNAAMRGPACAEALVVADRIGEELGVPVFLYGELAAGRTRAELRRGGPEGLRTRMERGEQRPDFGPSRMHATAGATLVAAREPLVAFNLELAPPATVQDARRIAALIREGGEEGLPGLRAIGVQLRTGRKVATAQVSMNVERPLEVPLRTVVEAVRRHADVAAAELVGLAPKAALMDFPVDVAMPAFDPKRQVIENALMGSHPPSAVGRKADEPGPSPYRLGL